jgi:hypothetical protein
VPSGVVVVLVAAVLLAVPPSWSSSDRAVRAATDALLAWLAGGQGDLPDGVLPERGTVRFGLRTLGSARSAVGPGQARAVLDDLRQVLRRHRITTESVDVHESSWAWVRVRATAPGGRAIVVVLLAFHAEGDRWVLRELREASP